MIMKSVKCPFCGVANDITFVPTMLRETDWYAVDQTCVHCKQTFVVQFELTISALPPQQQTYGLDRKL